MLTDNWLNVYNLLVKDHNCDDKNVIIKWLAKNTRPSVAVTDTSVMAEGDQYKYIINLLELKNKIII